MNQIDFLVGIAIGDGHITNDGRLAIRHSLKQQNYLIFKKCRLQSILNKEINHYFYNFNNYPSVQFSVMDPIFGIIRQLLYPSGDKFISQNVLNYLSAEAIAVWYMDDGSLSRKIRDGIVHGYELSISTYCSEFEADTIINYFSTYWNVQFSKRINKNKFTIRCGTREARKFIDIVRPFIQPELFYKIDIGHGYFSNDILL